MDIENYVALHRARLIETGYRIIPVQRGHKKPAIFADGRWFDFPGWSRHCLEDNHPLQVGIWSKWPACNVGICCGNIVAIDIDIRNLEAADAVERLAREVLEDTPAVRIGLAPKRALIYRTEEPFGTFNFSPLQVLCVGSQMVAYGTHPDTACRIVGATARLSISIAAGCHQLASPDAGHGRQRLTS